MRVIVHGTLEQVAAITPGPLVLRVASVSEPYENRRGTPRLHRVYLDAEIVQRVWHMGDRVQVDVGRSCPVCRRPWAVDETAIGTIIEQVAGLPDYVVTLDSAIDVVTDTAGVPLVHVCGWRLMVTPEELTPPLAAPDAPEGGGRR